jgi:hypothetical protein
MTGPSLDRIMVFSQCDFALMINYCQLCLCHYQMGLPELCKARSSYCTDALLSFSIADSNFVLILHHSIVRRRDFPRQLDPVVWHICDSLGLLNQISRHIYCNGFYNNLHTGLGRSRIVRACLRIAVEPWKWSINANTLCRQL